MNFTFVTALHEIKCFLWLRIVHGSAYIKRISCSPRREVFQNWSHLPNRLFPSFLVTRRCFRSSALRGPNDRVLAHLQIATTAYTSGHFGFYTRSILMSDRQLIISSLSRRVDGSVIVFSDLSSSRKKDREWKGGEAEERIEFSSREAMVRVFSFHLSLSIDSFRRELSELSPGLIGSRLASRDSADIRSLNLIFIKLR